MIESQARVSLHMRFINWLFKPLRFFLRTIFSNCQKHMIRHIIHQLSKNTRGIFINCQKHIIKAKHGKSNKMTRLWNCCVTRHLDPNSIIMYMDKSYNTCAIRRHRSGSNFEILERETAHARLVTMRRRCVSEYIVSWYRSSCWSDIVFLVRESIRCRNFSFNFILAGQMYARTSPVNWWADCKISKSAQVLY